MGTAKDEVLARPADIILDTTQAFADFRQFVAAHPWAVSEYTVEQFAENLFSHMYDDEGARESILSSYFSDMEDELEAKYTTAQLNDLFEALLEFGRGIWTQMKIWNIFAPSGCNWYYVNRFIGDDMVLERMDEDSITEDDDDLERGEPEQ